MEEKILVCSKCKFVVKPNTAVRKCGCKESHVPWSRIYPDRGLVEAVPYIKGYAYFMDYTDDVHAWMDRAKE